MAFLDEKYLMSSETALAIYNTIKNLPTIDLHAHIDVEELLENKKYNDPWELLVGKDYKMWELLRKRGVDERYISGEGHNKDKWTKLSLIFPQFAGNPIYEWFHMELKAILGIEEILGPDTGDMIWSKAKIKLNEMSSHPLNIINNIGVETIQIINDPINSLEKYEELNDRLGKILVRPTWRPSAALNIKSISWPKYIKALSERFQLKITSVLDLVNVLQFSHNYFCDNHCSSSDYILEKPLSGTASHIDADLVFNKAISGKSISNEEIDTYMSYLLGEMARMDSDSNWVCQLHLGAQRSVRKSISDNFNGINCGDTSALHIDMFHPLQEFLNEFDDRLKVLLYCLDRNHLMTISSLSRSFGEKVNVGSPWYLNNTPIGIKMHLEYLSSVDLLYNFGGMNSDCLKISSIFSRFDMFKRVLAETLAQMVNYGRMPFSVAAVLAERIIYSGPKKFWDL